MIEPPFACAWDTTADEGPPQRVSRESPLRQPLEVSGRRYGATKPVCRPVVEKAYGSRTLGGSVPTAKLAVVAATSLLGAALVAMFFGPGLDWVGAVRSSRRSPRLAALVVGEDSSFVSSSPPPSFLPPPVLGGVDVVAYRLGGGGVTTASPPLFGRPEFRWQYRSATFWFAAAKNRDLFAGDPERYAPRFGGFCAYGISSETNAKGNASMDSADVTEGWPWSRDHLGPPADVNVWRVVDDKLYFAFLPEVMQAFLDDYDRLSAAGEARWNAWFNTTQGEEAPFNVDCTADGYGPPVTRTCTFQPQRPFRGLGNADADDEAHTGGGKGALEPACADALLRLCGDHQGDNPVRSNACTACLREEYHALKATCPATDDALHASVDKAFCW